LSEVNSFHILTPFFFGVLFSESESYVTTDGQPASLSWNKAPIWVLGGALSDERSGLSFVCAAGPCQRSFSRVRVPWDLRPYFTVSDLRLPFSSPPTTRRVTVEVFDPASTRVYWSFLILFFHLSSLEEPG
jgi:hypothetical protein